MGDPSANKCPGDAREDGVDVFDASLQIKIPVQTVRNIYFKPRKKLTIDTKLDFWYFFPPQPFC